MSRPIRRKQDQRQRNNTKGLQYAGQQHQHPLIISFCARCEWRLFRAAAADHVPSVPSKYCRDK